MTHAEFLRLVVEVCALSLPPLVTPERLSAFGDIESGRSADAVSPPNRNGTRDWGLMQINEVHFPRFGVDAKTVMEPCTNIRIAAAILAEADRAAACAYNAGSPSRCVKGYDAKYVRAASRIAAAPPPAAAVASGPPLPTCAAPDWDAWGRAQCNTPSVPPRRKVPAPEFP